MAICVRVAQDSNLFELWHYLVKACQNFMDDMQCGRRKCLCLVNVEGSRQEGGGGRNTGQQPGAGCLMPAACPRNAEEEERRGGVGEREGTGLLSASHIQRALGSA